MTTGYACLKGLQAPASYNAADRVLQPLKRQADGSFQPIPLEQALDEIAAKLRQIIDRNGPDTVGGFSGAGAMLKASETALVPLFLGAHGSHKPFTPYTIELVSKSMSIRHNENGRVV